MLYVRDSWCKFNVLCISNDEEMNMSCPIKMRNIPLFIHLKHKTKGIMKGYVMLKLTLSPKLARDMIYFKCTSISFSEKNLMLNSFLESFQVQKLPLRSLRQIVTDWVFFCNCDPISHWF